MKKSGKHGGLRLEIFNQQKIVISKRDIVVRIERLGAACYFAIDEIRKIAISVPLGFPPNPQSLNRYSYVLNNPLIYTDPSGHKFWKEIGKFFKQLFASGISTEYGSNGWTAQTGNARRTVQDGGVAVPDTYNVGGGGGSDDFGTDADARMRLTQYHQLYQDSLLSYRNTANSAFSNSGVGSQFGSNLPSAGSSGRGDNKTVIEMKGSQGLFQLGFENKMGSFFGYMVDINIGRQETNLLTGARSVSESYGAGLMVLGRHFGGVWERSAEGSPQPYRFDFFGRIIPYSGRTISDMLRNKKFAFKPYVLNKNVNGSTDGLTVSYGYAVPLFPSFEVELNVTNLLK